MAGSINIFHNTTRRHTYLGNTSPSAYETLGNNIRSAINSYNPVPEPGDHNM